MIRRYLTVLFALAAFFALADREPVMKDNSTSPATVSADVNMTGTFQVGGTTVVTALNKFDATVAPTVNEDSDDGYGVGSIWIDVTADDSYICEDATVGAAIWVDFSIAGDDTPDDDSEVPDAITVNPINATTETAIEAVVEVDELQGDFDPDKLTGDSVDDDKVDAAIIPDADDDGTTKGVATFDNADFNVTAGVVTIAASGFATNSFITIDCPTGTDPVASGSADTLTYAEGGGVTVSGDSGTDTITYSITANGVDDTHIDFGTGAGQVSPADFADEDLGDISIATGAWSLDIDVIDATHLADADWGDVSVSAGSVTLDIDVVAAAEMADADHGDVAWSAGVATVEAVQGTPYPTDPAADGILVWDDSDTGAEAEYAAIGSGLSYDGTTLTATGSTNSFETMNASSGTDPVADSSTDTLNVTGGTDITVTGDSTTDTLTIALDGDLTGGTTLGGAAIQTGAEDDTPDDDSEVPDAITVNPVNATTETAIEAVVDIPDLQGIATAAQGGTGINNGFASGRLLIGDGLTGFADIAMSGDATINDSGVVTVANDSHSHTTTTISGIDISDDTNLAAGNGITLTDDSLSAIVIGGLVETVTTSASDTAQIPADDTIPQSTEGAEYDTITYTPVSTTSTVFVRLSGYADNSSNSLMVIALFKDSETDASRVVPVKASATNNPNAFVLRYHHVPGSTSTITYKMRYGDSSGSSTTYINRRALGDLYSTSDGVVWEIEEKEL